MKREVSTLPVSGVIVVEAAATPLNQHDFMAHRTISFSLRASFIRPIAILFTLIIAANVFADDPKTGDVDLNVYRELQPSRARHRSLGGGLMSNRRGSWVWITICRRGRTKRISLLNYDPATPCGIFVYLGYKDTVATPPAWHSLLDKSHLIFISPVSHTGEQFQPSIPMW